jgi:hypothetical protein
MQYARYGKNSFRFAVSTLPTTSTELGQKTARCESLRALLHYVEWDRIVTLAWEQKRAEGYVIVSN